MRTLFPLAVVLLVLFALPGVAVFSADLLGYGPDVNTWLEGRLGVSHRVALALPAAVVLWMVLPHHQGDFQRLPGEADVMEALHKSAAAPGQYMLPYLTPQQRRSAEEYLKAHPQTAAEPAVLDRAARQS